MACLYLHWNNNINILSTAYHSDDSGYINEKQAIFPQN